MCRLKSAPEYDRWTLGVLLDKLAKCQCRRKKCEDSLRLDCHSTDVRRICVEESLAPAAENPADTVRNWHGDWGICGPGGVFKRI